MNLEYIIDYVQYELDDAGVHYTQSGVSTAINEANKVVSILTLYYEKSSDAWTPSNISANGAKTLDVPSDCIVPIFVRDTVTRRRINPIRMSELTMEDRTWWKTYATSAAGFKYYMLWSRARTGQFGYSLRLYPRVRSATNQVHMIYAAVPPTISANSDSPFLPAGGSHVLGEYAIFLGLMRQNKIELAEERLQLFFEGVSTINDFLKSRSPRSRDFEPQPIEQLLERTKPAFMRTRNDNRRRTRRRSR